MKSNYFMDNKFLNSILLPLVFVMAGCATTLKVPDLERINTGESEYGAVLMSAGRQNKPGAIFGGYPFVDYKIYRLAEDGTIDGPLVKYVEAEPSRDAMANPTGHVGKNGYIFVHLFQLPEGKYVVKADRRGSRSSGFMVPGGGFVYIPGSPNHQTGNAFLFEVVRGKLNYLGEFLTVCEDVSSLSCIEVNDQFLRDFEFASKRKKGISDLDVTESFPKKVEYTTTVK